MVISTWRLQRRWARMQRPLALILLTCAALMLWGRSHSQAPTRATLVAARDVPAGQVLTADDVAVAQWPATVRPEAALAAPEEVIDRRTTSMLTAGEPLTATRVVGPSSLAAAGEGLVAVLLPEDPLAAAGLVRPGDRVDIIGRADDLARTLVTGVAVLTVTEDSGLIVAVPGGSAPAVVQAAGARSAAAVLRPD
jgi:Flp pilus assembly protein CpaB